ncbi:uncharacterized protein LOC126734387 [Anthonomus grandis grandis]|uniref:uncharacterized protein LOC126734387 n=1 Tax=Anthonomus grandis grandis TaxID=2921223 RepID=UPI0021663F6E|nr:uncharacterized protein LOC126734387 [Anthonomus grandis grandis]
MIVLRRLYSRRVFLPKTLQKVPSAKVDPGISRQKKILQESPSELEDLDFDELESDFMNVHKSQKQHLREIEDQKKKEKYLIVRQKYFKEKFPNFLTWHDKEQIRFLYRSNQEEWSIESLSEGFPALPDVVKKIVKGKWTKKNITQISNHDNAVLKNWNDFKQGKMDHLPDEIKEHLQKFSRRTLKFGPFQESYSEEIIEARSQTISKADGEFSEIIKSYEKIKNRNSEPDKSDNHTLARTGFVDEIISTTKQNRGKMMTFKELQKGVEENISKGRDISLQDRLLQNAQLPKKDSNIVDIKQEDVKNIVEHRHETNGNKVGFIKKTSKDLSHLVYPEKIQIPDDIYKRGYTYKLKDCYYDSDGAFLYRVPGMG